MKDARKFLKGQIEAGWLDFGEPPPAPLPVNDWIREVADDAVAAQFHNPYSIDRGLPDLCERQALYHFFPRLALGIPCKNGKTLFMERGNVEDKYGPDLVLRFPEHRPDHGLLFVDVERKTTQQVFLSDDLPIHIPVLTMSAHRGDVPYCWADGSWRKSGKMRFFEQEPDRTFFLAVSPDYAEALMVAGQDIIAAPQSWIRAAGPYQEHGTDPDRRIGQILVARVPRDRAVRGAANHHDLENAIMENAALRAALKHEPNANSAA